MLKYTKDGRFCSVHGNINLFVSEPLLYIFKRCSLSSNIVAWVCPYGIIKTSAENRIKSRVLELILLYFNSFSTLKFTRFLS